MSLTKPSITIGIPALNEAQALPQLLESLLAQHKAVYTLKQILVVSDASTDDTDLVVKRSKSRIVKLHRNSKRLGKPSIVNYIFRKATTDVVVILDADIKIKDANFISKLIQPIVNQGVALTSARVENLAALSPTQQMLSLSMAFKTEVFEDYKNGLGIFTCHGRARAFSRKFYQKLRFPKNVIADDAYSYLKALKLKLQYFYVKNTTAWYQLPKNPEDHILQSQRFFQSVAQLENYFDPTFVAEQFYLPRTLLLKSMLKHSLQQPILMANYLYLVLESKYKAATQPNGSSRWTMSESSKALN